MSSPATEVAADFRDALQDLRMNSRPEISNLTLIAKENTEYAEAISTELENHIRQTRPEFKLPALYVLDSIVKNVGTPYTVYLGRGLYKTFMEAYLVVDKGIRKAMEGLLRTWKMPVPESLDPQPVFPAKVTSNIEEALAKMQIAAQQTQRPQHALPARPPTTVVWRDTATPPQNGQRTLAPNDPHARAAFSGVPQYGLPMHTGMPPMHYQPPSSVQPVSSIDLADLKAEIAQLIETTKKTFAENFTNVTVRKTLEALLGLQKILDTQTLPPQQLEAIRKQVHALAPAPIPAPTFSPAPATGFLPSGFPPSFTPQLGIPTGLPPSYPPTAAPPNSAPPNVAQLLAGFRPPQQPTHQPAPTPPPITSLADLLKRISSPAQASSRAAPAPFQPPPFQFPPSISTPVAAPPTPQQPPPSTMNLAALLAQYNKPATAPSTVQSTPLPATPIPQLTPQSAALPANLGSADWLLKALSGMSGTPANGTPVASQPMARQTSVPTNVMDQIELTTASMKKPRFHLISRLYEAKPNICATCGRRFESTNEGKEKKARHMDWHFKVKDSDLTKRAVHRSWYIGEKEWIDYKEVDETAPADALNAISGNASKPKRQAKDRYVSVPQDSTLAHAPCPICQEKFETQWNVEANDFVWMDALQAGGKIYHATCFEEYSKGAGIPMPGTPDSVLGKRRAEGGGDGDGKKMRAH